MPILDYKAGSTALGNIQNATNALLAANAARSEGVRKSLENAGNLFMNYAKQKRDWQSQDISDEQKKAQTAALKSQTAGQNLQNQTIIPESNAKIKAQEAATNHANAQTAHIKEQTKYYPQIVKNETTATQAAAANNYAAAGLRNAQTQGVNLENQNERNFQGWVGGFKSQPQNNGSAIINFGAILRGEN